VTKELKLAIDAYYRNPGGYTRERGMDLICNGHLTAQEAERLEWALKRYREKVAKTT
jgi:hypothetical protein